MSQSNSSISASIVLLLFTSTGCSKAPAAPPTAHATGRTASVSTAVPAEPRADDNAIGSAPIASTTSHPDTTRASKEAESLTDAQILKITDTVNAGEIDQATLAKQKARNAEVKNFANHMVQDHAKAKQQGDQLAKQAALKPAQSAVSMELAAKGSQTLEALKSAEASSFDQLYIDAQVRQHGQVLDQLDNQLIPNADDPHLKADLEKSRAMVQEHLTRAKQIQASIGTSAR